MKFGALALAVTTMCSAYAAGADKRLENVTDAGGIYAELSTSATRWLDAARRADVDALVDAVLPEFRSGTRESLRSSDSLLSQLLLSGPNAVRRRFQKVERPGIRLLRHADLTGLGDGTTVCFFDTNHPPSAMPQTMDALPMPDINQPHFCLFFFREEGRWFASYGFADGPDD